MRRSLGKFPRPAIGHACKQNFPSFGFSTSAAGGGGGRGRGVGRGSDFLGPNYKATIPGNTEPINTVDESPLLSGVGRGRGKPLPSAPPLPSSTPLPSSSSFMASDVRSGSVAGRGLGASALPQSGSTPQGSEDSGPKRPIFFRKDEHVDSPPKGPSQDRFKNTDKSNISSDILSILSGAGRGKPDQPSVAVPGEKVKEINRHIKPRQPSSPKLSKEEAINKAKGILSRGGDGSMQDSHTKNQGYRGGGRGGRGRGRRGGMQGRGGRGGRGSQNRFVEGEGEDHESDTEIDKADADKIAQLFGPQKMDSFIEEFEDASARVLPNPVDDEYEEALRTNLMIECEPEYLMAEFNSNPDIDEKPPIPLREALQKMKPFLMAYENIQTDKEWTEVLEATMEKVPMMKELVDYYSGPDRVTAKKQQLELERVAKTLPENAPASVKRFTDRAVLSLQSNPGWGFDKKCQFMDKLVWQVSQSYKR